MPQGYYGIGAAGARGFVNAYLQGAQMIRQEEMQKREMAIRQQKDANDEAYRTATLKQGQERLDISRADTEEDNRIARERLEETKRAHNLTFTSKELARQGGIAAGRQKRVEGMRYDMDDVYKISAEQKKTFDRARKNNLSYTQVFPTSESFDARDRELSMEQYRAHVGSATEGYNLDTPWNVQQEEFDKIQGDIDDIERIGQKYISAADRSGEGVLFGSNQQGIRAGLGTFVSRANKAIEKATMENPLGQEWADATLKAEGIDAQVKNVRANALAIAAAARKAREIEGSAISQKKAFLSKDKRKTTGKQTRKEAMHEEITRPGREFIAKEQKARRATEDYRTFIDKLQPRRSSEEEQLLKLIEDATTAGVGTNRPMFGRN